MKRRVYPALGLLLALLTACAPAQRETPPAVTICRRPPAVTVSLVNAPDTDAGWGDFRCADLGDWELRDMEEELFTADFDTRTQWPEDLPESFEPQRLLELGKDPGLGLRKVHEQGITGKGVGIAIIDQTLLVEHREYADRLRLYHEYHTAAKEGASAHGPAVASIALGETVGVAPEALLYFIADDLVAGGERDMTQLRRGRGPAAVPERDPAGGGEDSGDLHVRGLDGGHSGGERDRGRHCPGPGGGRRRGVRQQPGPAAGALDGHGPRAVR